MSDLLYGLGWRVVRLLPERFSYWLFEVIADYVWWRRGPMVAQLERNLGRATDDPRTCARAGMRMYLRYWAEAFRLPDWDRSRIVDTVVCHGEERLSQGLERGGVLVVLPHMGNWDHAAAWAAQTHAPVLTIAERLKPESLFRKFLAYRTSLGMTIYAHDAPGHIAQLTDALRGGALVALLVDRDFSRRGVPVTLLGEATTFAAAPLKMAQDSGATVLPAALWREGTRLHVTFFPSVDVTDVQIAAQEIADAFSDAIRTRPDEWHVLQRVFDADRRKRVDQ